MKNKNNMLFLCPKQFKSYDIRNCSCTSRLRLVHMNMVNIFSIDITSLPFFYRTLVNVRRIFSTGESDTV